MIQSHITILCRNIPPKSQSFLMFYQMFFLFPICTDMPHSLSNFPFLQTWHTVFHTSSLYKRATISQSFCMFVQTCHFSFVKICHTVFHISHLYGNTIQPSIYKDVPYNLLYRYNIVGSITPLYRHACHPVSPISPLYKHAIQYLIFPIYTYMPYNLRYFPFPLYPTCTDVPSSLSYFPFVQTCHTVSHISYLYIHAIQYPLFPISTISFQTASRISLLYKYAICFSYFPLNRHAIQYLLFPICTDIPYSLFDFSFPQTCDPVSFSHL